MQTHSSGHLLSALTAAIDPGPKAPGSDGLRPCDTECAAPWPPVRTGTGKSLYAASAVRWCDVMCCIIQVSVIAPIAAVGAPPSVGCLSGLQLYRVRRGKRNGRRVEFSH